MILTERGMRDSLQQIAEARVALRNMVAFMDNMEAVLRAQLKRLEAKDREPRAEA